jgi:hypothetical protein
MTGQGGEMADKNLKQEYEELSTYEKKSLTLRAVVAILALAGSAVAGYIGRKTGKK